MGSPDIYLSVIVAGTTVTTITTLWKAAKIDKRLRGNGMGAVDEMLEHLVCWTKQHDQRHEFVERFIVPKRDED